MNEYDVCATTYDAQFGQRLDDIPFYIEEAKRAQPPVLELACGTGRVLIPVAKAGVQAYGLDGSPAMLDVCRGKAEELSADIRDRIRLTQADMRQFAFDESFGLIYCPFRAFLHLITAADQITALRNIHAHLGEDGRLALNFFNPDVSFIAEGAGSGRGAARMQQEFTHPESGNRVTVWATLGHDPVKQLIDTHIIHDEVDAHGRLLKRSYKPMRLCWIYRYEFEHLLHRCGFEVEALYGDFDRRPFTDVHQELIWIARKA
jgi:SAM-dependent methyltransferase